MRSSLVRRRQWWRSVLAVLGAVVCCAAWSYPPAPVNAIGPSVPVTANENPAEAPSLAQQIDELLTASFLEGAVVGIHVVDLTSGKVLYQRNATTPLNPASNIKLVTTAAALATLGPEHRYATRAYAKRDSLGGKVVDGDVWLRGSGDPNLVTGDLYELANDLHARGIREIKGGIVVDSTRFDRDELPPGYDQKDELAHYRATSGATSVNFNTFVVRVRGGPAVGDPAIAAIIPPVASVRLVNRVRTVEGYRRNVTVVAEPDGDLMKIAVSGTAGIDAGPGSWRLPIKSPTRYAGEVFALVLRQRGITIQDQEIRAEAIPSDTKLIGIHNSPPLSVIARSINKLSNNFMAEQVAKTLAPDDGPATFAGGLARIQEYLERIRMPTKGLLLGNGSGLYDTNRISAAQLTHVLRRAYRDFRYSSDFLASLPIMGVDGTTRRRLSESAAARYVRAKTGTLNEVSALSGYAGRVGKTPVAFSILINGLKKWRIGKARQLQDRVAELVALHEPPARKRRRK